MSARVVDTARSGRRVERARGPAIVERMEITPPFHPVITEHELSRDDDLPGIGDEFDCDVPADRVAERRSGVEPCPLRRLLEMDADAVPLFRKPGQLVLLAHLVDPERVR